MNIAFVINQTHKELATYTTTAIAFCAHRHGHTVHYIGLSDFLYFADGKIGMHARTIAPQESHEDPEQLLEALKKRDKQLLAANELDLLWLRYDPSLDLLNRPWASPMGLQFAQLIQLEGIPVLNDPFQLMHAANKLYLEQFPPEVRPKTIVTRNKADVLHFIEAQNQPIILKPLQGSGGKNVFMVDPNDRKNLSQLIEALSRDGYFIAQEYLPAAQEGDIRFFLVDGEPLVVNGKYACLRRVQAKGELRSNIHQGAVAQKAEVTPALLDMVAKIGPQLKRDGMYLVGLDVVGDKLMEINVYSPGALPQASRLLEEDFAEALWIKVEQHLQKRSA
jgi:glutathione synthase